MGAVACHVASFLTLKTPVIITSHVLTNEVGKSVEVICCVACSFSISFMASVKFWGPFLYTLVALVCAFFNPFRKILMVVVSLLNLHLLASQLNL